jgi:hypothetical protein
LIIDLASLLTDVIRMARISGEKAARPQTSRGGNKK